MVDNNESIKYENGRDSVFSDRYEEEELEIKIDKLSLHPTEAITLFFNIEKTTFEQIKNAVNLLKEKFSDKEVIALPDCMSLESCSKDVLENIISMISEVIERL